MPNYSFCYVANPGFTPTSVFVFCGLAKVDEEEYSFSTLEHTQDNTWITRTDSRTAADGREVPGCATVGGKGYLFGGGSDDARLLYTDEYTKPSTWVVKTDLPSPARWKCAAAPVGATAIVFGGTTGTATIDIIDDVDIYTPGTNSYATGVVLPSARYRHTACTVTSKVYLIGGYDTDTGTDTPLDLNTEYNAGVYTSKTAIPTTGRSEHGAAVIADKIYVVAGFPDAAIYRNQEYVPGTDTWATKTPMIEPGRAEYPGAALAGKMYIPGGKRPDSDGRPTKTTTQYDPATDAYILRADLPTAQRRNHAGTAI